MTPVVGIIGLGLIGGSIARDLAASGLHVLGYDADHDTLERALESQFVAGSLGATGEGCADVDWLIVAVPVDRAADVLRTVRHHLDRASLVTDVGSTKRSILAAATELGIGSKFVGSHPFAGSHTRGWDASRTGMFSGARVFLCPTLESTLDAMSEAGELWSRCGATVEIVQAADHDQLLAWSSHLPHMLSTVLAATLADADVPFAETGSAAGDMLRLAASDPDLWAAIGLDNADHLSAALRHCETAIAAVRTALDHGDRDALLTMLRVGTHYTRGS